MRKDLTTMYNGLAIEEKRLQNQREKWLQAQEYDPYAVDECEEKLEKTASRIRDRYGKYFNIRVNNEYEIIWE